jgi:DNA-binding SARP family transcriptional activator
MIRFHLLGGLDLRDPAGGELRSILAQPKRLALLAYLALEASDGFCRRDRVLALFWPEFDAEHARLALRQALHFLRGSVGSNAIVSRGDEEIGVAADLLWCDAVAFQESVDRGHAQDALDLYRGDLLPGFFISDASPDFETWLDTERTRLRRLAAVTAWKLAEAAENVGNATEAALRGRDAVRLAPDDEAGVRRLIGLLDRLGDRAGALRAYDSFAQWSRNEFDLEPAPETRVLMESVRARSEATLLATAAVASAPGSESNIENSHSERQDAAPQSGRRRWATTIAVAAVGLIGVATLLPHKSADSTPLLAVGWVENQAGTASAEAARLIPGLLATDLSRVRGLAVVSDARLYEVLGQLGGRQDNPQVITDAARRAGADQLVQGVLYRRSEGWRLDLRRSDLRSGVVREAYTVEGADVFDLTDRATAIIARSFSLDAPSSPLAQSGTGSLAARRLYEEGLRALFRGESRGAHDLFAASLGEDSTFAMAAYYAGVTGESYDAHGARRYFAQSIRMADRAPERDRLLIKVATQFSDHAVSLAAAETLASRFPSEPTGHLALGTLRFAAGDFLSAIPHARRGLVMDSLSLKGKAPLCRACEAYALMANAYISADSLPAAERTVQDWISRQPSSSVAWNFLSVVLSCAAQYERARAALHEAEKLQPSPGAVYRQVEIAIHAGDYFEADRLLRARLNYDARDADALWYLGISLRNQGRLREAIYLAERERALSDPRARLAHGQVLFELGRFREAAAEFDSVAHFFGPTGPMVTRGASARHVSWNLTHTATALAAAGDTAALQTLSDSIEGVARYSSYGRDWRLPDHVRGLSWLARGQLERAAQSFRAAIFSPTVGYTRTNFELARVLVALGRPTEAVSVLQPALRGAIEASNYYVTRTELHELLARSFQLANQRDSAAAHYRAVIAAWSEGDPPFRARADTARNRLAVLR